jgi:putative glycosyltransferase (TIGR04372 family)
MNFFHQLNKHINQIKRGGTLIIKKKIVSLILIGLQIPIYLLSIPIVILIHLIRPWFLIRWQVLESRRIGHFATDTELYSCNRSAKINQPSQMYFDIFFLGKFVCNKQLEIMLRRSLTIFPAFLLVPLFNMNRFIGLFIKGSNQHEIDLDKHEDRDVHNIVHKLKPHISFSEEEELKGKLLLKKFGIPENSKFVCLIVRDSAYLGRKKEYNQRDYNYHNYRNGDIDKYILAAEELASRGYYVFRMGKIVKKPLKSENAKVIDYANSKMRNDFMDIYLGANCTFCISTWLGYDSIPFVFRKPIAFIFLPFGHLKAEDEKNLLITKHHINKTTKKRLTISEIFSANVALSFYSEIFKKNNVELEENTPEEIKDFVIEMEERLSGKWKETQEDLILQNSFWQVFEKNLKRLNLQDPIYNIKNKAKFGATFLRKNQNWIK